MCQYVSWIEAKGKVLFLTDKMLKIRHKKMKVKFPDLSEQQGHGAIRWFYELRDSIGLDKECRNFSNPSNFPKEIVKAIKKGQMGYGVNPEIVKQILTKSALKELSAKTDPKTIADRKKANADRNKLGVSAFNSLVKIKKNRNNLWK